MDYMGKLIELKFVISIKCFSDSDNVSYLLLQFIEKDLCFFARVPLQFYSLV